LSARANTGSSAEVGSSNSMAIGSMESARSLGKSVLLSPTEMPS